MEYHISFDGGGTKLAALLYDEKFRLLAEMRTGSLRESYTPPEMIQKNLKNGLEQLFAGRDIACIRTVRGCFTKDILAALQSQSEVCHVMGEGEGQMGLSAAGIQGSGLLALCGTGAGMFYIDQDRRGDVFGSYGAVVFDEGSGYHIGRMALAAAIRHYEGWGEPTVLNQRILAFFGGSNLRQAIFSIYHNPDTSPIAAVASLAPLVSKAAFEGDDAALAICACAGSTVGSQMNALIARHNLPESVPLTVSGGVWKGHGSIYRQFLAKIREESPERPVRLPYFEPVVGSILAHYMETVGPLDESGLAFFQEQYANYKFRIGEDATC